MGKIVSQKIATKDNWIFSKSFNVFTPQKIKKQKKNEKSKTKGEEMSSF